MIYALAFGAAVGLGLVLFARGFAPSRPSLAASLARLDSAPARVAPGPAVDADGADSALLRWGRRLAEVQGLGFQRPTVRHDLLVVGRPLERHVADKLLMVVVGAVVVPGMVAIMGAGGVSVSPWLALLGAPLFGLAGFVVPDILLQGQADDRRRDFRFALSSYFDLVVVSLAGGGGVESALYNSAEVGRGWAFARLQRSLAASRLARETPWAALGRLGEELGVDELRELAASVGLAGTEGARVRESLAAKARSVRSHELSRALAEAESASTKMSFPVVMLCLGFLIFVGYPAIDTVLNGI